MFYRGLIEGFYGQQWTWAERHNMAAFLGEQGYDCYIYAPKGDAALRNDWRQPFTDDWLAAVSDWAGACRRAGVRWGLGLSPKGLQAGYGRADQRLLRERLRELASLSPDLLWILFDDMRGDTPALARNQCAVLDDVLGEGAAAQVAMCPTYYSFDPLLQEVFGTMPKGYLEQLGLGLPREVEVLWTGKQVLSADFTEDDCARAAELLRRLPLIWDNYPVNDGRKTSNFLHLDAFRGRPWQLEQWASGHMANPMNQPHLSQLALSTLPALYRERDHYDPDVARAGAFVALPEPLSALLQRDWQCFQREGRSSLSPEQCTALTRDYATIDHPAAAEVRRWLEGGYQFDPACLND